MLSIIRCDHCDKSGMFDFELKFHIESHLCEKCSHHTMTAWDYYFCNITCLMKWLKDNQIEEKGLHCRDCRDMNGQSTGFRWGFESNGTCDTCKGSKRVKTHKLQEWETRKVTQEEA